MRLAVFKDLHLSGLQVGDQFSVFVGYDSIDLDQVAYDLNHIQVIGFLCLQIGNRRWARG